MNTQQTAKHTPLKLHNPIVDELSILDKDGNVIAEWPRNYTLDEQNLAEFIVRACNSHYELVEALKTVMIHYQEVSKNLGSCLGYNRHLEEHEHFKVAVAILTSAQGKEN